MDLNINGVPIVVPETAVADIIRRHLLGNGHADEIARTGLPRIGESWQGGIFAGIARGRDGKPDYPLILGDAIEAAKEITWDKATAGAAATNVNGFTDWRLPFRAEQSLLFANVPELFREKEWYWSCEQLAAGSDYAWMQYFGNGVQYHDLKSDRDRARAVRSGSFLVIR